MNAINRRENSHTKLANVPLDIFVKAPSASAQVLEVTPTTFAPATTRR